MRIRLHRPKRRGAAKRQRYALIALCAGVLCCCLFGLIRYAVHARQAWQIEEELQVVYHAEEPVREPNALSGLIRQYTVSFHKEDSAAAESSPVQTTVSAWPGNPAQSISDSFLRLRRQNRDIVAWLSIPGLLEQAVVQRDNSYYLRRDYRGYHNENGALFLEAGISLASRPSAYIVFGHNMKNGQMFGGLRQYENAAYYRRNAVLDFNVIYEDGQYVIFAVSNVDTTQGTAQYAPFMQLNSLTGEARMSCIDSLRSLSLIASPVPVDEHDQLLLLVTCEGSDSTRRVVAARRLREGENAETLASTLQYAKRRESTR